MPRIEQVRRQAPKTAILFPGEYNAYVGMLSSCRGMPVVQEMIELATECFDFNVEQMLREGPEELITRQDYSQMLMYLANCVAFEVLKQDHPDLLTKPYSVAGWSVGEVTALVAAGIITFDQGLIIVKERAVALQEWARSDQMASLGIFGLDEEEVERLMRVARNDESLQQDEDWLDDSRRQVYISHYWCPLGVVCSGRTSAIMALKEVAEAVEAATVHVLEHCNVAAHTELAEEVALQLETVLRDIPLEPPGCEVYFNAGYRVSPGEDPETWIQYFARQLKEPVRWDCILQTCIQRGVQDFYECGPGESLKELMIFNVYTDDHMQVKPFENTKNIRV